METKRTKRVSRIADDLIKSLDPVVVDTLHLSVYQEFSKRLEWAYTIGMQDLINELKKEYNHPKQKIEISGLRKTINRIQNDSNRN